MKFANYKIWNWYNLVTIENPYSFPISEQDNNTKVHSFHRQLFHSLKACYILYLIYWVNVVLVSAIVIQTWPHIFRHHTKKLIFFNAWETLCIKVHEKLKSRKKGRHKKVKRSLGRFDIKKSRIWKLRVIKLSIHSC